MDLMEPIKVDHNKLLNKLTENVEKHYDVTNDYPEEVKVSFENNRQVIVNDFKNYFRSKEIKTIMTNYFKQLSNQALKVYETVAAENGSEVDVD